MTSFKSASSGRLVVSGWNQIIPEKPDTIEVQFDLSKDDMSRSHACLMIDYWANPDELTLHSVIPMRAFLEADLQDTGWCVFVPAQGRLMVRAVDLAPIPPTMASQWINIDPSAPLGTVVNVHVTFPESTTLLEA